MERPVGDIFEYYGTTLEVVESYHCSGCYFFKTPLECGYSKVRGIIGHCGMPFREDVKNG